jgi:uncharacterized protein (DUF1015 family)
MASIKPFKAIRPKAELAEKVAELPYDVVSSEEAGEIAKDNKYSFFHISKPEIDMGDVNVYSQKIYDAGRKALESFISEEIFIQEGKPNYYLYTQTMDGRSQTGIVACVSIDDYIENRVKKHELTREDKELDRTNHLDTVNANTGPVFLFFKDKDKRKPLFVFFLTIQPIYDFVAADSIRHTVRIIEDETLIQELTQLIAPETLYIADGHHRAASAVRVGINRRKKNPNYTGKEEFNSFLAVIFPHSELKILAYNRVVKDLNRLSIDSFMEGLKSRKFTVEQTGKKIPGSSKEFSMYLDKNWYTVKPNFEITKDPVAGLDVRILQDNILAPILGIDDPRKDKRINFVGGIRGTEELEKITDNGEYAIAFSMYPTTLEQLINVSDVDQIMPPKSTWFEPKLRSGLLLHSLD